MMEAKRFVSIAKYQRMTGLSYPTVIHMMNTDQLSYIETESGQRRIDTQSGGDQIEIRNLLAKLEKQERMLSAICRQFNVVS